MIGLRAHYTPEAAAIIRKLAPEIKAAVRRCIEELLRDSFLGKELGEELTGFRSHRVRHHRIIYHLDNEDGLWLAIHYVGPRRDVYEAFNELLRG